VDGGGKRDKVERIERIRLDGDLQILANRKFALQADIFVISTRVLYAVNVRPPCIAASVGCWRNECILIQKHAGIRTDQISAAPAAIDANRPRERRVLIRITASSIGQIAGRSYGADWQAGPVGQNTG